MKKIHLLLFLFVPFFSIAQNVGIGTTTPAGKLHIKGSADTSQLTIDANATQTNYHPLIRLRNSAGVDLVHINSDNEKNVFIGLNAGRMNDQAGGGVSNTFIGAKSGFSNSTGFSNTVLGSNALYSNTTGNNNTANGYGALYFNTSGNNNTASGYQSLAGNIIGNNNSAFGVYALTNNTSGTNNTAGGSNALNSNKIGVGNTAFGESALKLSVSGSLNTAIGPYVMSNNNSGSYNTAVGYNALNNNTTGIGNIAVGLSALSTNITGRSNVAIGAYTGNITTGNFNIMIGENSGTDPGSPNIQNTISIGNDGFLNAANNQAFIGNKSTAWIGGNVNWSTFSDARIKTNIKENVKGLDFIMKLRPVTYFKSMDAITQLTGNKETPDYAGKHDADKILQSGFLAQEVEQAAKSIGYNFSGLHAPANSKQLYSLSYSEFVVPLVKAMQEQQKMITDLQALIKTQQAEIDILKQKVK
ncbi:MAG: tail fiber domain-containing protein [Ginsengibacter sp.]